MRKPCILIVVAVFGIISSCTQLPEADFYEVDGIVSIETREVPSENNWVHSSHHTGIALTSVSDTTDTTGILEIEFYVQNPGRYVLWTLGRGPAGVDYLPVRFISQEKGLLGEYRLMLENSKFVEWQNFDLLNEQPVTVRFQEAGFYAIQYFSRGKDGYLIDKIHMTEENEREPTGYGFPPTMQPGMDPVLARRDQPVVIPPAWAFGVLYGGLEDDNAAGQTAKYLLEHDFPIDGVLIDKVIVFDEETDRFMHDKVDLNFLGEWPLRYGVKTGNLFKSFYEDPGGTSEDIHVERFKEKIDERFSRRVDFMEVECPADLSLTSTAFKATQIKSYSEVRGFIKGCLNTIYDPDFKQYSTVSSGETIPDWSYSENQTKEYNQWVKSGLKEQIQMSANSRLSIYEVPYLSHTVSMYDQKEGREISEELFTRWIQFLAFNTIMGIDLSENGTRYFDDLSDDVRRHSKELLQLRNQLFPYLYSKAHLVRATGQKPVRGDGIRTTQFQLGEALLVAPIYEQGADQRTVYLPEGTWYDYWDGTSYSGGQSWFIETPLTKIPVFVKAGSIIPYREYSQTILNGTNERLKIEIYGGGASSFRLYEDDGVTTNYQLGDFSTTAFRYFEHDDYSTFTIGRMVRQYKEQPPEKKLELRFKYVDEPAEISVNGHSLEMGLEPGEWYYSHEEETLYINWVQPNYQKTDFRIEYR